MRGTAKIRLGNEEFLLEANQSTYIPVDTLHRLENPGDQDIHLIEVQTAAEGIYSELKNLCVWVKTNAGMGSFYRSQHEMVFVFKAGQGAHINNFGLGGKRRHRSNSWTYAGANTFRRDRAADLKAQRKAGQSGKALLSY